MTLWVADEVLSDGLINGLGVRINFSVDTMLFIVDFAGGDVLVSDVVADEFKFVVLMPSGTKTIKFYY